jgi:predicted CXXCH cytochrome family protein
LSKRIWRVCAVAAVAACFVVGLASTALAAPTVIGTVHDLSGATGNGACQSCHVAHGAKGSYLWAQTPHAIAGDSSSALKPLCYSCHDGTQATSGMNSVFVTTKRNHKNETGAGNDCDRCHDPHDNTKTHFMRATGVAAGGGTVALQGGGNICASCHSNHDGSTSHMVNAVPSAARMPTDQVFNADATPIDQGTRLWTPDGLAVSTAATAQMKCLTCHTPHGGVNEQLNTMSTSNSALCLNCHKL